METETNLLNTRLIQFKQSAIWTKINVFGGGSTLFLKMLLDLFQRAGNIYKNHNILFIEYKSKIFEDCFNILTSQYL
jgi:hypothetical protein